MCIQIMQIQITTQVFYWIPKIIDDKLKNKILNIKIKTLYLNFEQLKRIKKIYSISTSN